MFYSILSLSVLFGCLQIVNCALNARVAEIDSISEKQFPYQVSVQLGGKHLCGGTILTEKFIVTAAHCVTWSDNTLISTDSLSIRAGSNVLGVGGVVRNVTKVTVHEHYGMNLNDIALMELTEPLTFTDSIKSIEINKDDIPANTQILISGWGKTSNKGKRSEVLKYVTLSSLTEEECGRKAGLDFPQLICLDHPAGTGACKGDSGGPAVYDGKLIGVASGVYKVCGTNKPDLYVKVSNYYDWIKEKI